MISLRNCFFQDFYYFKFPEKRKFVFHYLVWGVQMPKIFDFFIFFLLIIYVLSGVFISIEARKRKIGVLKSILACLFLTPVAGYFFVSKSKHKDGFQKKQYKCRRCGHKYAHYHKYCPTCESNGRFIKLKKIKN